ncbi:hypothetical protein JHK86_016285 [Glycine max]|nr:hypothetical protein JHK86_016285 [Glycine max]
MVSLLQSSNPGPWIFLGDFNVVQGAHEKRGSLLPLKQSCEDLCNCTTSNGRKGSRRIDMRLDRIICNHQCFDTGTLFPALPW